MVGNMADPLNEAERAARMAKVRATGNKSTEGRVEIALTQAGIVGWEKHPRNVLGRPDFFFPHQCLALFVDGCFWHACPICRRRTPTARAEFWRTKIDQNRRRDNRNRRQLRQRGYHVMRVWEHDLKKDTWLKRLRSTLRRIESQAAVDS